MTELEEKLGCLMMKLKPRTVIRSAAKIGLLVGIGAGLTQIYHEVAQDLAAVDQRADTAELLARTNTILQQETMDMLARALRDSLPVIEPIEGEQPAKARQVPCEGEDDPAVCGLDLDFSARIVRLPEACGTVQLRVALLRQVPGTVQGLRAEIMSWVVPDLLANIPPVGGVMRGTLSFTTLEPVYAVSPEDLAWSYFPRCGAASSITPFERTVFD